MNLDTVPAVMFATGCSDASSWLANNSARPKPISAAVCRALRLSDMVMRYETEDNFPDLLAAWEKGFDSIVASKAVGLATDTGHAPALLAELKHAHAIIKAMLNAMTTQQKSKVHEQLDWAGVSGEGMTRANERLAVIEAAEVDAGVSTSDSDQEISRKMLDIEARAVDILLETERAEVLLQAVFEQLDRIDDTAPGAAAINCFATCTARAVALMREAADNIVALVAEGGAA